MGFEESSEAERCLPNGEQGELGASGLVLACSEGSQTGFVIDLMAHTVPVASLLPALPS